jgi:hypothetical protein
MTITRILDILLGEKRLACTTLAHEAIRYVVLPDHTYTCYLFVYTEEWRRPRAWLSTPEVRYRVFVDHKDDPIPLAAWSGEVVKVSSPDVSGAVDPQGAVRIALLAIRNDVIQKRRGVRPVGAREGGDSYLPGMREMV